MSAATPHIPHQPVMVAACLEGLAVARDRWYIDGTFGAGGHTRAILEAGGCVLAIDRDPNVQRYLAEDAFSQAGHNQTRLRFAQGPFGSLARYAAEHGVLPVAGVLLDLGVSSMQLDEAARGFSFRHEGPLDMRMGDSGLSASDLVNHAPQDELASIIFRYGEERHSRRIARGIVAAREHAAIATTGDLAEIVAGAYPGGKRREHPARRTFQALRIAVNDELGELERALSALPQVLASGGRVVVLSYHSLEDRLVKRYFKTASGFTPLTKKPLTASATEIAQNPRARSAKLRAAVFAAPERTADTDRIRGPQ